MMFAYRVQSRVLKRNVAVCRCVMVDKQLYENVEENTVTILVNTRKFNWIENIKAFVSMVRIFAT